MTALAYLRQEENGLVMYLMEFICQFSSTLHYLVALYVRHLRNINRKTNCRRCTAALRHKVIPSLYLLVFNAPFERINSVFNKRAGENANNANYNRIYTYGGDAVESKERGRVLYT